MYIACMNNQSIGFTVAYAKGDSLAAVTDMAIARLFPSNPLASYIRSLPVGTDQVQDVNAAMNPLRADLVIDDSDSFQPFFFGQSFKDIMCFEFVGIPKANPTFIHKPIKYIPNITTANLSKRNTIILMRPKCMRDLDELGTEFFKKNVEGNQGKYKNKLDVLVDISSMYMALANSEIFGKELSNLEVMMRLSSMSMIGNYKYGKDFDLHGTFLSVEHSSLFPARFKILESADQNAIRLIFYFIGLLGKYDDNKQLLAKEFGIGTPEG